MDTLKHRINHTKSINNNSIDTKEKLKKLHKTLSTANDTKENTLRSDVNNNSSRILSSIQNNVKHNAYNRLSNGLEADRIKHSIDQNCAKTNGYVNGHSNHDCCTVVKKFQKDRKSIR